MENSGKIKSGEFDTYLGRDFYKGMDVYSIYDTVLQEFGPLISLTYSQLDKYMKSLVNDIQSPYYGHESDYVLHKVGEFNLVCGEFNVVDVKKIGSLDLFIDRPTRNLQIIVKCLNYLPQGYFKMPEEMKKSIQDKVDESIKSYVENYVIPDIDMSKYSAGEHQSHTLNS